MTTRDEKAALKRGAQRTKNDWTYDGQTLGQWLDFISKNPESSPDGVRLASKMVGAEACSYVEQLVSALESKHTYHFACAALGKICSPAHSAVASLLRHVSATPKHAEGKSRRIDEDVARSFAAEAVARIGPSPADLPTLVAALKDPYFAVGRSAAEAIGTLGTSGLPALPDLVLALEDYQVDLWAAKAIGKLGPGAVTAGPALLAAARAKNWHDLTAAAVEAAGKIGYTAGLEEIQGYANDRFADVRKAVDKALVKLSSVGK